MIAPILGWKCKLCQSEIQDPYVVIGIGVVCVYCFTGINESIGRCSECGEYEGDYGCATNGCPANYDPKPEPETGYERFVRQRELGKVLKPHECNRQEVDPGALHRDPQGQ